MSLSTLLEAAKYLDLLDSNNYHQQQQQTQQPQQQQQQQQHQQQQPLYFQTQPLQAIKKSSRRQRFSKKNAANTMVAMSLPTSTGAIQMHGVPIPFISPGGESHQAASLSSSFTTGSPLSSFASTALFCSKASGVTSASSSAASSLSSSDSSSSCGEILMGDNDFNQSLSSSNTKKNHRSKTNNINNNNHNYHLTHQTFETNHQLGNQTTSMHQFNGGGSGNNQSIARFIAATSTGPQLVTMTTSSTVASASAPIDGSLRAGHVIHAATNNGSIISASPTSTSFDPRHFSMASANGIHHQQMLSCHEGQTYSVASSSFGCDNQLSGSPGSCPPLIMARVQPMILNSLAPPAHQSIMAFQHATASSPTSSSSSYSRHRELHKTLEKNRRAHLRHCFELLKAELPASECVDKKTSHINIIKSAIRYVLALRQQECEIDNELQRLTKIKTELTENLAKLRTNGRQPENQPLPAAPAPSSEQQLKQEPLQQQQQKSPQQPVAEQQLSFLLSQSKID